MWQRWPQSAISQLPKCSNTNAATLYTRLPSLWPAQRASFSSIPERVRRFSNYDGHRRWSPGTRRALVLVAAGSVAAVTWTWYNTNQQPDSFVAYKLVAKRPVSSTASIFELEPLQSSPRFELYKQAWKNGIWNVHVKQPQLQIVRSYTPLPPAADAATTDQQNLQFLIRKEPYGEVSNYLHSLPIGATVDLRGPNMEYPLMADVQQVLFFAGGTGIAPALQVAYSMFDHSPPNVDAAAAENHAKRLHILWANRRREDCLGGASDPPPAKPVATKASWSGFLVKPKPTVVPGATTEKGVVVEELERLKAKHPGQVTVEYFVNEEDSWIDQDAVMRALSRLDDIDFSTTAAASPDQRQILISGPSGFISYLAGPKEWRNGREEQGQVSRIIAHAMAQNPHSVKVWKV